MDLSPQHIEMVCGADKIQELWKPDKGDYVYLKIAKTTTILIDHLTPLNCDGLKVVEGEGEELNIKGDCSWIPRFDQYQELVYNIIGLGWILFFASCTETYSQICKAYGKKLDIMPETIALMLIMDRGFNLTWDSQEKKWTKGSQIIRV